MIMCVWPCLCERLQVTSGTPLSGSHGGGAVITLTGRGFAPLSSGASMVSLCGRPCRVTATSYTSLQCVTPVLPTLASVATVDASIAPMVGAVFGTGGNAESYGRAFDGNVETTSLLSGSCNVGIDLGLDSRGVLKRIRYFPNFNKPDKVLNGVFEASVTGSTYTTVRTVTGRVQEGWNYADVDLGTTVYRYFRYRGASGSLCEVTRLQRRCAVQPRVGYRACALWRPDERDSVRRLHRRSPNGRSVPDPHVGSGAACGRDVGDGDSALRVHAVVPVQHGVHAHHHEREPGRWIVARRHSGHHHRHRLRRHHHCRWRHCHCQRRAVCGLLRV
jgi:hypothetical protein